ncbi:MAG TPA: PaaI family thioesterase [Mesorhizobium sp.]|nr:PaaI family thioesterase [Mesorhizobium sp.]
MSSRPTNSTDSIAPAASTRLRRPGSLCHGLPMQRRRIQSPERSVSSATIQIGRKADSAMGCAVHSMLKPGHAFTTVDMTVSFVRAVLPTSGKLTCEGKIIHFGGRIATAEGRVTDVAGKLIAHGTETCMILNAPPTSGV